MAVIMDLECSRCGEIQRDVLSTTLDSKHAYCDGIWKWLPSFSSRQIDPMIHISERAVVYVSDQEGGKIQYPGRNDVPVPERLRRRGYVKKEMGPHELKAFERSHGVINERLHYDRNGRSYEE